MDNPLLDHATLLALTITRNASILVADVGARMDDSFLDHATLLVLHDRFWRASHTSFPLADARAYVVLLCTSFGG